jgi:hypothetical protein
MGEAQSVQGPRSWKGYFMSREVHRGEANAVEETKECGFTAATRGSS